MSRTVIIPEKTVTEAIRSFEHLVGEFVRIGVGPEGRGPAPIEIIQIGGDDYQDLMSAHPAWAPSKPADTFRMDDLWHFVDKSRE